MKVTESYRPLIMLLLCLTLGYTSYSQSHVTDIPAAFAAISTTPQRLHLKGNGIKPPSGGHLQGVQCMNDTLFIITGSSGDYSYYLTADKTQLTALHPLIRSPYRHAGGCQLSGTEFAVGVEDNIAKDRSDVVVISLLDPKREINHVIRRAGQYKRSTAGAVGMASLSDRGMIAVGAWDSRDIDFYTTRPDYPHFDSVATYRAHADSAWCSYQAINLVTDGQDRLYLIGLGLSGVKNRADLFEVKVSPVSVELKSVATKYFKCKGTSFRYAAGVAMTADGKMTIYSTARNAGTRTAINIFR